MDRIFVVFVFLLISRQRYDWLNGKSYAVLSFCASVLSSSSSLFLHLVFVLQPPSLSAHSVLWLVFNVVAVHPSPPSEGRFDHSRPSVFIQACNFLWRSTIQLQYSCCKNLISLPGVKAATDFNQRQIKTETNFYSKYKALRGFGTDSFLQCLWEYKQTSDNKRQCITWKKPLAGKAAIDWDNETTRIKWNPRKIKTTSIWQCYYEVQGWTCRDQIWCWTSDMTKCNNQGRDIEISQSCLELNEPCINSIFMRSWGSGTMNQCMSCHPLMRTSQEVNMGVSETVSKILHLCRSRCSLYTQILQTVSSSQKELSLKFKSNHSRLSYNETKRCKSLVSSACIEVRLLVQNKSRFMHFLYLFRFLILGIFIWLCTLLPVVFMLWSSSIFYNVQFFSLAISGCFEFAI